MATPREAQYFGRNYVWFGAGFQITTSLDLSAARTLTENDPRLIRYDASSAGFTIAMSANPAPGSTFTFKEVAGSANAVLLDGNGKLIDGAASYLLNVARRGCVLRFSSISDAWEAIGGVN